MRRPHPRHRWSAFCPQCSQRLLNGECPQCPPPPTYTKEEIQAQLARALEARDRRNEALDEMNEQIRRIEKGLFKRHQGQAATIELETGHALLWWVKDGWWGLWVLDNRGNMKQLLKSSKDIRIAAASVLSDLWNQLQYEEEPDGHKDRDSTC